MPPLIEVVDVARHYRMGDEQIAALDGVSFAIERGEMVAIVGASGSGKSTLLHILGCLDTPSRGRYRLRGQDVQDLADDERDELAVDRLDAVAKQCEIGLRHGPHCTRAMARTRMSRASRRSTPASATSDTDPGRGRGHRIRSSAMSIRLLTSRTTA